MEMENVIEINGLDYTISKKEGVPGAFKNLCIKWRANRRAGSAAPKFSASGIEHVFNNASLTISRPGIYGFKGPNGSGKSTLLQLLFGAVEPDSGSIKINGDTVAQSKGRVILCHPSVKPFGEFSAVENAISLSMFEELDKACITPAVRELLLFLKMREEDLLLPASSLSDGGKRKTMIVGAIVRLLVSMKMNEGPHILALDEPTNALDEEVVQRVYSLLVTLRRDFPNLTIVIATNSERDLTVCDQVWAKTIFENGQGGELIELKKSEPIQSLNLLSVDLPKLDKVEKYRYRFIFNAFLRRNVKEILINPFITVCLVLTLILPNLVALFSGEGGWSNYIKTVIGIFVSCIVRDAFRLLERERGYFGTTYLSLLSSKVGIYTHFVKAAISGLIVNSTYALIAALMIYMLHSEGLEPLVWSDLQNQGVVAFCITLPATIFFAYGLGNMVALWPFLMRDSNHFFLLSLIPMGIFIFSGWYYPPENMFVGLASLAYGNPLTYLALLLQSSGESEIAWDLVKATWMLALWYFGSSLIVWGYGNRLVRMVKRLPVK